MPASALVNWKAASTMASRDWRYSSHACPAVLASSAASAVASARLPVASEASSVEPVRPWTTWSRAVCDDTASEAAPDTSPSLVRRFSRASIWLLRFWTSCSACFPAWVSLYLRMGVPV